MGHDTFQAGDITAVIGDNSAHEKHRAGYNGVWSLTHRTQSENLFVPTVAGLNFEHIFDGDKADSGEGNGRKIFFEPRYAPMTFKKLSATEAELHQPPTPTFHVESWTRFAVVAPHYIDMSFRFKPTQHAFNYGYIGLFWACYINAPEDKSIYFRQNGSWQQLCSQAHNDESTVRHRDDKIELKFRDGSGDALFKNISRFRYDEPFYYGLFRKHIAILMFDRMLDPTGAIRFTQSPSGGGVSKELQTTLPAWDFQYILPKYELQKEYSFRARLAYRERCDRAEVLKEVADWQKLLR